jgi:hypothetical protein
MGKILKTVLITGIFLFCGMFILRIMLAEYWPAAAKNIYENSVLDAAYSAEGLPPKAFSQDPVTPYDNKDRAHFFFNHFVIIPDAKQIQLTLRYNNGTLEDIQSDMQLDTLPAGDDARFSYYLRDENGNVYAHSSANYSHFMIYNYRRVVFDNVDTSVTGMLYLDVYFGEADPNTDVPYGSMLVYVPEKSVENYPLPAKK